MKELHRKGLATHPGPESCADSRKAVGEALTGENAGQPLSCEIHTTREPTLLTEAEGNTLSGANSKPLRVLSAAGEPEHAWTLFAREPGDPENVRSKV